MGQYITAFAQDSLKYASPLSVNGAASGFRPDVEGLRALAVVSVIIYHFSTAVLPGGYLGVDIFFVISGYVITQSLMNHRADGVRQFIIGFYVRRIKRLLPALITVVVVTSLLICMVNYQPEVSIQTGISALFGLSNLYLMSSGQRLLCPVLGA